MKRAHVKADLFLQPHKHVFAVATISCIITALNFQETSVTLATVIAYIISRIPLAIKQGPVVYLIEITILSPHH